jgi:putative ABC transport system permease protein
LSSKERRFETILISSFAMVALLLAAIGLYAVLTFMVAQRRREIGLRMALGARRFHVLQLVLGRGLTLAFVGLGLGLPVAIAFTRLLAGMLFGVGPFDVVTFAVVSILLLMVALLASLPAARDAMRVDPMNMLREE